MIKARPPPGQSSAARSDQRGQTRFRLDGNERWKGAQGERANAFNNNNAGGATSAKWPFFVFPRSLFLLKLRLLWAARWFDSRACNNRTRIPDKKEKRGGGGRGRGTRRHRDTNRRRWNEKTENVHVVEKLQFFYDLPFPFPSPPLPLLSFVIVRRNLYFNHIGESFKKKREEDTFEGGREWRNRDCVDNRNNPFRSPGFLPS